MNPILIRKQPSLATTKGSLKKTNWFVTLGKGSSLFNVKLPGTIGKITL